MKSFYIDGFCEHCLEPLYCYRYENNKWYIDCSNCNNFKEVEFPSLRLLKKKFNIIISSSCSILKKSNFKTK